MKDNFRGEGGEGGEGGRVTASEIRPRCVFGECR